MLADYLDQHRFIKHFLLGQGGHNNVQFWPCSRSSLTAPILIDNSRLSHQALLTRPPTIIFILKDNSAIKHGIKMYGSK